MPVKILVDTDLADLVPGYLANRRAELPVLVRSLAARNYGALQRLGHQLAGSGGAYGFDRISELGLGVEREARAGNAEELGKMLLVLGAYLEDLELVYK